MKRICFDEIVKKRAAERVEVRIKEFKIEVGAALLKLLKPPGSTDYREIRLMGYEHNPFSPESRSCLAPLSSENPNRNWPPFLWAREEAIVEAEIMKQLDELQRAILAKGTPGENEPAPPPATDVTK